MLQSVGNVTESLPRPPTLVWPRGMEGGRSRTAVAGRGRCGR